MIKQPSLGKWILCGAMLAFVLWPAVADATDTNQTSNSVAALETMSLEQLVNVEVTSVSKKETELFASPAAVSVITQDDIHRNGFTSIPEALRMVPGMDVADIIKGKS